jgi:hypothetical protein
VRFADDDSQVALWQYGRQLGCYSFPGRYYRQYLGADRWGPKTVPPVEPPPCPEKYQAPVNKAATNYGVELDRLEARAEYHVNGRRVSRAEAFKAIAAGGTLADDSGKLRLTVIGSVPKCQTVLEGLGPLAEGLLVQCYPPGHWATAVFNLDKWSGSVPAPAVFLEAPPDVRGRAKVLYCQLGDGDPERLREAVRRADPNFTPRPTPQPEPPKLEPQSAVKPFLESVPLGAWLLLAALVLVLTRRK